MVPDCQGGRHGPVESGRTRKGSGRTDRPGGLLPGVDRVPGECPARGRRPTRREVGGPGRARLRGALRRAQAESVPGHAFHPPGPAAGRDQGDRGQRLRRRAMELSGLGAPVAGGCRPGERGAQGRRLRRVVPAREWPGIHAPGRVRRRPQD